jgi:hypothetical protein
VPPLTPTPAGPTPIPTLARKGPGVILLSIDGTSAETIAGYMLGKLDRIPKVGDEVGVPVNDRETLCLRVEVMDGKRIAWIVMSRLNSCLSTPKSPFFRIVCR